MPQAPARGNGGIVNPNAPIIFSPSMGLGAPTFTTRSPGTRLVLRDALGASSADYALGLESGSLWLGVGDTSARFKLYFGTIACYTFSPQNMVMFLTANRTLEQGEVAGVGDLPSGVYVGSQGSGGISLIPSANSSTAGAKVVVGAHNGSAWRSMVEAANVASGEPNLLLAKSGGNVGVGSGTPTEPLHLFTAAATLKSITMENAGTYHVKMGLDASNNAFFGSTNATAVNLKTNNSNRISIATDGLVTVSAGVVESGVTRRTSGASYTMLTGDRVIVFASGSSGVLNLIASPETGRVVDARNDSGGDITLTPAAGNINGVGTLALPTGTGWTLRYDGTQWVTFG